MQIKEALRLREGWGNKPCDHLGPLSKEYHLGGATGDYVCTTCGHSEPGSDWNRKEVKQKPNGDKENG